MNIDARLKLLYGETYGLKLSSEDNKGEDHLIVGGGDEMGGYDDSQFQ